MTSKEIFATRLKLLRQEKGFTQKQLAKELQISLPAIVHYENANRFPGSAVLTLLSQFFNVSKEYLTGESNEREPEHTWDDTEIMETVRDSLPTQISGLNDILKGCSDQEEKLVFDILVELAHVLRLPDATQRTAAISLLEGVFAASTRYADVCIGAAQDIDLTRMEKAKKTALSQYGSALDAAVFFRPE